MAATPLIALRDIPTCEDTDALAELGRVDRADKEARALMAAGILLVSEGDGARLHEALKRHVRRQARTGVRVWGWTSPLTGLGPRITWGWPWASGTRVRRSTEVASDRAAGDARSPPGDRTC